MYTQLFLLLLFLTPHSFSSLTPPPISSNSILIALLDSRYSDLSELIEKANLLPTLESSVLNNNLTFFAPDNSAFRTNLDTEFRQFLLEPRNLKSLQSLLLSHIVPSRVTGSTRPGKRVDLAGFVENPDGIVVTESTQLNSVANEGIKKTHLGKTVKDPNGESTRLNSLPKKRTHVAGFGENGIVGKEAEIANSFVPSRLTGPTHLNSLSMKHNKEIVNSYVPSGLTEWTPLNRQHKSLSNEKIDLSEFGEIVNFNDVVRPDGVIHGISKLRIPKTVMDEFNSRRSLRAISAIKPEGAPEVDPRTHRLKKPSPVPVGSSPVLPIYDAMAPGPSLAPAPAPGPGGGHRHFDGEAQVKDFIQTLVHYGGYNELADILVNLTSLATEMGRLVSEGYVLTVLAPNDEAMAKLTTDRLSEPGAPEQIIYYHVIPEYQTEESMYNSVRRFGKVKYDTLRLPHKVTAEEADGSVKFGFGDGSAYLFDPDIYTDGRISVQGIDGVLFPFEETKTTPLVKEGKGVKVVKKVRRGKLLETACGLLGAVGHNSHFSSCQ